jgi:hypothetical protein
MKCSAFRTRKRKSWDASISVRSRSLITPFTTSSPMSFDLVLDLGEPHRGVDVAKPARALLELGLEEIDRVAVATMTVGALGELFAVEARGVLLEDVGLHRGLELGVERRSPARNRASSSAVFTFRSFCARRVQSATVRLACPTTRPASQSE